MRALSDYRVYGQVWGLTEELFERIAAESPFETAVFEEGVLVLEHEGGWIDVESAVEDIVQALPEGGEGNVDLIDNLDWTVTRYVLFPGGYESETYSCDDVLEHTKGEGNF